jgi:uncharacterized protein (TIGR02594 family)
MLFKTRMMLTIGCLGVLAMSGPAFSQPLPEPRPKAAQQQGAAHRAAKATANRREDRASRLVSTAVSHPPKAPAFGWPVLVKEARKYMGTNPTDRTRLWCATFMNMVLAKTGYSGTNSDAAKSFAQYGRRISEPKVGAIAVLTRGKKGGHVGVVSGIDANGNPVIISGNHGRKVGEAVYPRSRVIAYVMPSERRSGSVEFAARASERGAANRSTPEGGLESPITELLAAIEAEQTRSERPRGNTARQPVAAPEPHLTVQQAAEAQASDRRDLPLEPGLAEFLGIKERGQRARRATTPPQRQQRVEQQHNSGQTNGRVAADTGLATLLGLPLSR